MDANDKMPGPFSVEQKEYLQGFMAGALTPVDAGLWLAGQDRSGAGAGGESGGRDAAAGAAPPAGIGGREGSAAPGAAGGSGAVPSVFGTPLEDLCREERWKLEENPLDAWERLVRHAEEDRAPDAENTYRFKTFGLFYVAPAQDSFMMRLRLPACEISSVQMRGLADLAAELGAGCSHVTTRGNLQIREFKPRDLMRVLIRVQDLGLTSKGSGADNVRNITVSPDSGLCPGELIDARPHAKALHHYILNHRDLYGLPRKFNVAFDTGGPLSVAVDTNDIGFLACRVTERSLASGGAPAPGSAGAPARAGVAPGVYFRVQLGGITGHLDFARDTGLLVKPSEAVAVAAAMIRVFNENADRSNRKKARLKYLLEAWGVERFLEETARRLAFPLVRLAPGACEPRGPVEKHGWLGVRRQSQAGLNAVGLGIPVGRMSARQMRGLADLASNYGRGELRLTVWQTVLLPHIPDAFVETVKRAAAKMGFPVEASLATGGVIACTGSKGCKYAAADTKGHALGLIKHLGGRIEIGSPVNIHFTGCPHSCAQHYCGDIGLVGVKLPGGEEGYHMVLGGGMDDEQGVAREVFRGLRADEINPLVERVLLTYKGRSLAGETFVQWARRHSLKELQEMLSE